MKRNTVIRWIGEMIVVFFSVVGAFWFEDFRHTSQEKEDYINTLHQFRNHLASTVWQFRITQDTAIRKRPNLLVAKANLILADSLLNDRNPSNDTIPLRIIIDSLHTTPNFREASIFYDQLRNFGDHIQTDRIFWILNNYSIVMSQEYLPYADYNTQLQKLEDYLSDKVDFRKNPLTIETQISTVLVRNAIRKLRIANSISIRQDERNAQGLSQMVNQIDDLLLKYEIDSMNLDQRFLLVR